jgi:acyl carrier protein
MPQDTDTIHIDTTELVERVSAIVAQELELDGDELDENAQFVDDYGADSLSLLTVLARTEKELGIRVREEEQRNLVNLKALVDAVLRQAQESNGA